MKKAPQNPPRLVTDPELTDALSWTQEAGLSTERLARGEEALMERISGPAIPVATSSLSSVTGAALKVVLPLAVVSGVSLYVGQLLVDDADDVTSPNVAPPSAAVHGEDYSAESVPPSPLPKPENTRVAPTKGGQLRAVPAAPAPEPAPPEPAVPGVLDQQLAIFDRAKTAADRGDPDEALRLLDHLKQSYPDTPLLGEVALSRVHYLVSAHKLDDARTEIQMLLLDPGHTGRRGELLRLLGDIWVKRRNCVRAVEAYKRAKTHQLSDSELQAVLGGLKKCSP